MSEQLLISPKKQSNTASETAAETNLNNFDMLNSGNNLTQIRLPQFKLSIGSPDDPLEHEADAIADRVMRMPEDNFIQRKCASCEEEDKVQRKPLVSFIQKMGNDSGMTASDSVTQKINSTKGSGSSIDSSTKSFMESRFGSDFSGVKIHTGDYAVQLSNELKAQAFTVGNDVYFNSGKYNPETNSGKHLLAHELTHTVQQGYSSTIQRSCTDGNCDTCLGGRRTLRFTVFFRTRATRATMTALRERINEAKRILNNCCIRAVFDFDWRLLRGGTTFNWGNDPTGSDYSDEAESLGEGSTFSGARGIPIVVADTIPNTGGGVTVTPLTDPNYTGVPYIAISVTHGRIRAIAHEGGHVGGILTHNALGGVMDGTGGTAVTEQYCTAMRALAL